jgi:hypothetical protein
LSDLLPLKEASSDSSIPAVPTVKAVGERSDDWEVLLHKMNSLGVSRFSAEGETSGRVTFSCLIPLAGQHAVTQRFEAEGSSLIQATKTALRRVTLWRAAQIKEHPEVSSTK